MKTLHRAAAKRAYRTLAQGLGGTAVMTAATAAISGTDTLNTLGIALGTTVLAAIGSFWQGVAAGLPESTLDDEPPNLPARHVRPD